MQPGPILPVRPAAGLLRTKSAVRAAARTLCALLLWGALPSTGSGASESREALQKAAALVEEGRLEEADRLAQRALGDPETRAAACSVLGAIRLQQDRLREGSDLLREAIRLEPRLLGAHLNLAQVYTLQGRPERAVPLLRRVLELDPENTAARIALARAALEEGNHARSLELASPARAEFEQSPEGVSILVAALLKKGDHSAALALVEAARRLPDASPAWLAGLAETLVKEGLVAEGIGVLEHAGRADAGSYELAFALGGAHLAKGDEAGALEAYDRALALRPDSLAALRQAAAVAERRGELERSLSYWMRGKKLAPDDPQILLGFGRVCLKMDLLEDAEPALAVAARHKPGEPAYQYTLAVAKVGKRQYEAAQALLEPLVAKRPDDAQLRYALGSVLYVRGHLDEAAAHLRESLRLDADQLASPYYLALVARDEGRAAEAIEQFEALLRRYPDHAASCEALGGLYMNGQRYADAETYLRRALELDPRSSKASYQLGLLLARTGRKEEAARQLELAKTLRKEDEASSRLQLRLLDPDA